MAPGTFLPYHRSGGGGWGGGGGVCGGGVVGGVVFVTIIAETFERIVINFSG